jgi:probable addiction module antidote protein
MDTQPSLLPFDPSDHLTDETAIAVYLNEALASQEPAHVQDALQVIARARGKMLRAPQDA